MKKLVENKAQCKLCGDILVSESTHDKKTCSCGNLTVDGGLDYIKRNWKQDDSFIEMSVEEDLKKVLMEVSKEQFLETGLPFMQEYQKKVVEKNGATLFGEFFGLEFHYLKDGLVHSVRYEDGIIVDEEFQSWSKEEKNTVFKVFAQERNMW